MRRNRALRIAVAGVVATGGTLALAPSTAFAESVATLVAMHSTADWNVPSPDPAGITYDPGHHRLVISDSEVDEMPLYRGTNIFFSTLGGKQSSSNVGWTTEPWSVEATGISRLTAGMSLVSDDDADRVYQVRTRANGKPIGTPVSFSTRPDNGDAEDVTLAAAGTTKGHIVTIDGKGRALYDYGPGPDGVFDGIAPAGDDTRAVIDLGRYGVINAEGLTYYPKRNALLVVDNDSAAVYELTRAGRLLNKFSISAAQPRHAAGIALAPASNGSGRLHMYIVDRGVDNDTNPSENDGRLYEMSATL